MTTTLPTAPPRTRPGRRALGYGALLAGLAIGAWMVQILVLKVLVVAWYVPVMGAAAALLAIIGFCRSPTVLRGVLALVVAPLGAFEVWFVIRGSLLPNYAGPIAVGSPFPAFTAEGADGGMFTDADLRGQPTVLAFFRGRW